MEKKEEKTHGTRFRLRSERTILCSGSEAGSYLRRIDFCITQL